MLHIIIMAPAPGSRSLAVILGADDRLESLRDFLQGFVRIHEAEGAYVSVGRFDAI